MGIFSVAASILFLGLVAWLLWDVWVKDLWRNWYTVRQVDIDPHRWQEKGGITARMDNLRRTAWKGTIKERTTTL